MVILEVLACPSWAKELTDLTPLVEWVNQQSDAAWIRDVVGGQELADIQFTTFYMFDNVHFLLKAVDRSQDEPIVFFEWPKDEPYPNCVRPGPCVIAVRKRVPKTIPFSLEVKCVFNAGDVSGANLRMWKHMGEAS